MTRITFDPAKNERNIAERGLSFELAAELEWDTALIREDVRKDYGETRLFILGSIRNRLHALVITPRGDDLRVVSLRKANKKERTLMKNKKPNGEFIDKENPEWTADDMQRARPAAEVLPLYIGQKATDELLARGPGRPPKAERKVNQTLRIDSDVLEAYRLKGKGWQTHINQVLREHMPKHPK